jgi:hypothetical protein
MSPYLPTPREGPSPFLPGTCIQFSWDSTCLGEFKRCPRKYQLNIIEGWRGRGDNVHLTFGSLYTEALDQYDKLRASEGADFDHEWALMMVVFSAMEKTWIDPNTRGECDCCSRIAVLRRAEVTGVETYACARCFGHHDDEFDEPAHPWEHGEWDTNVGNKNRFTLIRTIVWHLDQFGVNDPAETVILQDGTAAAEYSFRMELDWGPQYLTADLLDAIPTSEYGKTKGKKVGEVTVQPYLLCGHLDRVVTFLGGTYVMDHKTTKNSIGDYYFDQYEPNNQMTLYTLAAKVIFKTPIKGVIIDAAQVAVGFSRFSRGMTYRTDAQLEEWVTDLRHWLALAEHYATERYWPMNDTACFGCQFNQHNGKICAKDPAVRHSFLESHFDRSNPWNPLKPR